MQQIAPQQLKAWLDDPSREAPVLLDVREPWEFGVCRIAGSVHIPMQTVPARLHELDPERDVVVICHHGHRSFQVAMFLERNGFNSVHNLFGGVDGWAKQIDPAMALY
jgi:rhodanese-related sulfurtransferase